jgi:O-methyltransferase involved in polyketide biosynthesis
MKRETYLTTLYGKALDAHTEHPILGDTFTDEVVQRIDYDYKKIETRIGQ